MWKKKKKKKKKKERNKKKGGGREGGGGGGVAPEQFHALRMQLVTTYQRLLGVPRKIRFVIDLLIDSISPHIAFNS